MREWVSCKVQKYPCYQEQCKTASLRTLGRSIPASTLLPSNATPCIKRWSKHQGVAPKPPQLPLPLSQTQTQASTRQCSCSYEQSSVTAFNMYRKICCHICVKRKCLIVVQTTYEERKSYFVIVKFTYWPDKTWVTTFQNGDKVITIYMLEATNK